MPTAIRTINSSKLLIRLGDGASPEQFVHPCMINTARGIEFGSSPTESVVPFCPPDEDLPGWVEREIDAKTASVTGAGILHTPDIDIFWNWYDSGASKNLQVFVDVTGSFGGGYWAGAAVLTGFSVSGAGRREKATFESTILSDGAWAWVNNSG